MEITMTGRHYHISDRFREYAGEKLESLEKFHPRLTHIEMVVKSEHDAYEVNLHVHVDGEKETHMHSEDESLDNAFHDALHKVERNLRRQRNHRVEATHHA